MQRIKTGIRWAFLPILVAVQSVTSFVLAAAQDARLDVNINTTGDSAWYTQWWVWVLIGLFALIVIVAITSRGRTVKQ